MIYLSLMTERGGVLRMLCTTPPLPKKDLSSQSHNPPSPSPVHPFRQKKLK